MISLEKHQQLMDRLTENYNDYRANLLLKERQELIDSASQIAGTADVFHHLVERQYTEQELDYLLQFQNPLEVIADRWVNEEFVLDALEAVVVDVIDRQDNLTVYPPAKEMNAGYQIIAKIQVGPVEYALGEMGGKFPSFVTWERTPANDGDGPPNYYWGHYFDSQDKAMQDLYKRASEKYEMLTENRKPSIKAQLAAKPVPGDKPVQKSKDREAR